MFYIFTLSMHILQHTYRTYHQPLIWRANCPPGATSRRDPIIIIFYLYLSIYPIYQSRVYRARFHNLEEPLRETNLASLSISALIIYQGRPFRNLLSPLRTPLFAGTPLPTPSVFPKSIYPQPSSLKGSDSTEVRTFQLSSLLRSLYTSLHGLYLLL